MTPFRYILQSLLHYRFAYLGVLAGTILGATVLLGALFAGDSVAASLRRIGEHRIGRTTHVVSSGDRFFRQQLAGEFAAAANTATTPVLYARGTAVNPATRGTANQVQLVGVTDTFWSLAPTPTSVVLNATRSAVAVNVTLARRLQLKVDDTLIVRLQKPGILVGNAPVAGAESTLQTLRCSVAAIVDDESFGRFTLETTQVPQPSIFLTIERLQEIVERPGKANLLLIDATRENVPAPTEPPVAAIPPGEPSASVPPVPPIVAARREKPASNQDLDATLTTVVQLGDYGLSLQWAEAAGVFEVTSDRIFIDAELASAMLPAVPDAQPVVSYLINEFRVRDRSTPYSIATATTSRAAPFLPADLGPRDIVLNDWLAGDLNAAAGDDVQLTFFQAGAGDSLVEHTESFRVRSIIPLQGLAADRRWMPSFPGMSDAADAADWDPGLPLNLDRIRPKDETYWDDHRGAPKAFISLEAGRAHWATRWGTFTALRLPFDRAREAELTGILLRALEPRMNELLLSDIRTSVEASARSPVDFGGLFVGMSFFLILAALGLVAMLFQLSLLQRNREDALLGAVGVPARRVLRWRLAEALGILLAGGAIGLALATLYTRGILRFLDSIWAGQGAGSTFTFAAHPTSIVAGGLAFFVLSLLAIWLAIRRQTRRTLSIRLAAHVEDTSPLEKIRRRSLVLAAVAGVVGGIAIVLSGRTVPAQAAFYLAGFSLLICGIALCRAWMARPPRRDAEVTLDARHLGVLNVRARRSRSLTVVGLIATAVFMVLSVASFRKHVGRDWLERSSGTGGFAFWVETTVPQNASRDGTTKGFEVFERHRAALGEIIPLRAGVGDNANCFNLNSTAQPRLLAVDSARLAGLNAFTLKVPSPAAEASSWRALRMLDGDAIPALVDETTLLWALKRKVGDTLTYPDENGVTFTVKIVGTIPDSIFQGYLIVDEKRFLERFPSNPGYSIFLIDARDSTAVNELRATLETTVRDAGGRVDITRDVLAAFHQIENTYIAIFNVLGSLGVILGSLGLAIVVARNLRERRGEFAVMSAIGIPRRVLARMVFAEFGTLVVWGIAIGMVASLIAVWPSITALPAAATLGLVLVMLVAIVVLNLACGWAMFHRSMRDLRPSVVQGAI